MLRALTYISDLQFSVIKLFSLSNASLVDSTVLLEAQRLQGIIARADAVIAKASIAGTKYLLERFRGYGGIPRRPLPPMEHLAGEALWNDSSVQELIDLEQGLSITDSSPSKE